MTSNSTFGEIPTTLQSQLNVATQVAQREASAPGVIAGLFDADSLTVTSAGFRQAGGTEPMTFDDPVFLGSTFKAVTATLVGKYVDRGELRWDTTLSDAFAFEDMDEGFRNVTLRQVLSHRGGFGDDIESLVQDPFEGDPHEERAYFLPKIMATPPQNEVGTFSYSNIGYTAAGMVLEQISGKPFFEIVGTELAKTLELNSLSFGPPESVAGHDEDGIPATLEEQELAPAISPAGLFTMNLQDWAVVARQQCHGSEFVTAETLSVLHAPVGGQIDGPNGIDSYALGWGVITLGDKTLLTHNGSNGYWLSSIVMDPESCRGLLVSTNQLNAGEIVFEQLASDPHLLEWVATVPEPTGLSFWLALFGILSIRHRKSQARF